MEVVRGVNKNSRSEAWVHTRGSWNDATGFPRNYNRLVADGRSPSTEILTAARYCLKTLLSPSGYSAYQLVFGSNPADRYGRLGGDDGLLSTQDTSVSGRLAQQWTLRAMAQKKALTEMATS